MKKLCLFLLPVLFIINSSLLGEDKAEKEVSEEVRWLKEGQTALRAKEYKSAITALNKVIEKSGKREDEGHYLKALAQYYAKDYPNCIKTCDNILKNFTGTKWIHKTSFLKAAAFVQQRKYQEAEAIYEKEADRLLAADRKQDVAGVIIHFADELATKPNKSDLKATPPNYNKAYKLYAKALGMEISRELRDSVTYKKARAIHQDNNINQAIEDYRAYLNEFDPDWMGNVGSPRRTAGMKKENPQPGGKFIREARFHLASAQVTARRVQDARVNAEDLIRMFMAEDLDQEKATLLADTRWLMVKSYNMPNVSGHELELGLKATRNFLAQHKSDPRAVYAAWWIAEAYRQQGRSDDAIQAYEDFYSKKNHALPKGDALTEPVPGYKESPAKLQSDYNKVALYQKAQIRFGQKKYQEATETWAAYINMYPDGPHWSTCQRGIINASYQIAMDAVEAKEYAKAQDLFENFLNQNPLDSRAGKILFLFGQIAYHEATEWEKESKADSLDDDKQADAAVMKKAFDKAISIWERLASKYPNTEEASVALYRIGLIQEEKFGDWKTALETYRRITFGSKARNAKDRIAMMTKTHLGLQTEKVFLSNEQPVVRLETRNIKKVTVKQYFLDLEAYFRKTHAIGNVDHLDVALIEPDKSWEIEIENYDDYRPIEQDIKVPYQDGQIGACLINVSDENFEATSIVIRSDLDIIVKSSRQEALVFVENRRLGQPAEGVKVLLSDGKKVFHTGETEEDGVYREKLDELKDIQSLRAFVISDGHIASNNINLNGLNFSSGLVAKGYLYVDRPAYQPGETVKLRGILRDVEDGSYVVPEDKAYLVSVTDSSGRLIWETEQMPGKFGTFQSELQLDRLASQGNYTLTARDKDKPEKSFSTQFIVKKFQLEKIRIKMESDQNVYFRGETIDLSAKVEYYWGQPVSNKQVTYYLPDGRSLAGITDEAGKLEIKYDTTGSQPGNALNFRITLDGENVTGQHHVFLAREGFTARVSPSRPLVLAGEPFDVTVSTETPDGEPVGKDLTLYVLYRQAAKPNPILRSIPWHGQQSHKVEESTMSEHKVTTDPKTGKGIVQIKLEEGGEYILRVAGDDRFQQTVTAEGRVKISDAEDETKLRFFSESDVLQVGSEAQLRLHSRLGCQLALLTFEGEEILEHRVINLKEGFNDIPLQVDHDHFPNFTTCINAMDGKKLHVAHKPFTVERQLNVTIQPGKDTYAPGAEAEVEVTVTDQLGNPVEAELSLALINEALFSIYPDNSGNIRDFFQEDARRKGQFRVGSSTGFSYEARTRKVIQEFLEEKERLARREREQQSLQQAAQQVRFRQLAMETNLPENPAQIMNFDRAAPNDQPIAVGGLLNHAQVGQLFSGSLNQQMNLNGSRGYISETVPASGGLQNDLSSIQSLDSQFYAQTGSGWNFASGLGGSGFAGGQDSQDAVIRRELAEDGYWLPNIVTDKAGKAKLTFTLPSATSEWRLTSKGITVKTLAGQSTATVVTRKPFFVSMKAPSQLQEGDSIQVLSRVHNLTDFEGNTELELQVLGGEKFDKVLMERTAKVEVSSEGVSEALFESITIPSAANLRVRITAKTSDHIDILQKTFPVRPWGLEFADHDGGSSTGNAKAFVSLPQDRREGSQWMTITVGPKLQNSIMEMALGQVSTPWAEGGKNRQFWLSPPRRIGGFAGSDLMAVVAALDFARKANAEAAELVLLERRAHALIGSIVVSQRSDGGWSWKNNQATSHWGTSATTFSALCAARDANLPIHGETINNAKTFLKNSFTKFSANDNNSKSLVMYALSEDNSADFAHANRLYRERNSLNGPALTSLILAFCNLDRMEFAKELLDLLQSKLLKVEGTDKNLLHMKGVKSTNWTIEDTETTALAAMAFMKVRPGAEEIRPLIDYLLSQRGGFGFINAKARGPAISALAEYYQDGKSGQDDYELTIKVNGQKLETLKVAGGTSSIALAVPTEMLSIEDENVVDFEMNGRGEYHYGVTLRGFSQNMTDPKAWNYPHVDYKRYYHMPLTYRGNSINVNSSTQVQNVAIGQRVKVHIDMDYSSSGFRGYRIVEEYLPAGMILADGTLKGNFQHHEIDGNKITLYYPSGGYIYDINYEMIAYTTGEYKVLPVVIRDSVNPGRMRVGPTKTINILAPSQQSEDPYTMNHGELYTLGRLNFNDGNYQAALKLLSTLRDKDHKYNEKEVCEMLLWIYTGEGYYDAKKIVEVFEVLRERYPALEIPFDKILTVGRAYRDLEEYERAYLVFKATIDASFINDINVSAILEDEGLFLGSIDYQEDLWKEYPDTAQSTTMFFSISQALYLKAPKAHELEKEPEVAILRGGKPVRQTKQKPEKVAMLRETIRLLNTFLTLHPENPLADDAAFSMANALLDLKLHDLVIDLCARYKERFPESEFSGGYQYMRALGHFWKHNHPEALKAAAVVANSDSKDKNFAQYIIGQIHHAEGNPASAIEWYQKVKEQYPDAKQAIDYFEQRHIRMEEINTYRPGEDVELNLKYRNIKDAFLQVYKVDLMKLYLREKNLSKITSISLAGIAPLIESSVNLGDGKDYVDKETKTQLDLKDPGAYLVICRGDDLYASSLVLVTPLKIEVQEDKTSGRVRANVRDVSEEKYIAGVHVKAIGSMDKSFKSGETDLRGLYIADELRGTATVIARNENNHYAFYRGKTHLGTPANQNTAPSPAQQRPSQGKLNYRGNLDVQNDMIQKSNWGGYDSLRRATNKGVQIMHVQ